MSPALSARPRPGVRTFPASRSSARSGSPILGHPPTGGHLSAGRRAPKTPPRRSTRPWGPAFRAFGRVARGFATAAQASGCRFSRRRSSGRLASRWSRRQGPGPPGQLNKKAFLGAHRYFMEKRIAWAENHVNRTFSRSLENWRHEKIRPYPQLAATCSYAGYRIAPTVQGTNSFSPMPRSSERVFSPEAVARMRSKICRW